MDERRLELKVGALALVALGIGVALIVVLSGAVGGNRFIFHADFGYAGGLPAGAQVKIAGVKVGRVKSVAFRPEAHDADGRPTPVRLTAEIDRATAVALHLDASAAVGTQGALGESYLEVLPGRKPGLLVENSSIPGLDPPRLDVVLARLFSVLESASNDAALRNFLVELANIAHSADEVMRNHREEIARFLADTVNLLGSAHETMNNLQSASKSAATLMASPEIKEMISDFGQTAKAARTEIPTLLSDTRFLVEKLKKTTGSLNEDDVAQVKEAITRLDALAGQLQKVSSKADNMLAGIDRGEGTIGKMVKDPQIFDDLRALLMDIKAKPWKLVWKE